MMVLHVLAKHQAVALQPRVQGDHALEPLEANLHGGGLHHTVFAIDSPDFLEQFQRYGAHAITGVVAFRCHHR